MDARQLGPTRLTLRQGDITRVAAGAIVNAANAHLAGGGGVDGAIHRTGGPSILAECRRIGGCPTGSAVVTGAGRLPAHSVIHAVAPRYHGRPADDDLLRSAYATALRLADEVGVETVALPSLGTGAYGWPVEIAAPIALDAVAAYVRRGTHLTEILFVLYTTDTYAAFARALAALPGDPAPGE